MADVPQETLDGTVTAIVFRNDETGYSVLRVSGGGGDGAFRLKTAETVVEVAEVDETERGAGGFGSSGV